MTHAFWEQLKGFVSGTDHRPPPAGFIIDSPWLPGWAGVSILDYLASDQVWLECNLKAHEQFPEVMFLPGFWMEYGMCTEPSAFGCRCSFPDNEFPHPARLFRAADAIDDIEVPDVRTSGLLPLVMRRLACLEPRIRDMGHAIRFAASRGPLNIATFLMGTTEFLMAMKLEPAKTHRLLAVITEFIGNWLSFQRECFPSIDGVLLLDDIVGLIGEDDFREFAHPHFTKLFSEQDVAVKFFHNDAPCAVSAPYYAQWGVNLYNPGVHSTTDEILEMTGEPVRILGTIPPRDVLAQGPPSRVRDAARELVSRHRESRRIMPSCAGGMPPGVSTENIQAFLSGVAAGRAFTRSRRP